MNNSNNNEKQLLASEGMIFPCTVNVQMRFIDGQWTKFYTIFNNDGSAICETPQTKEEILEKIELFAKLIEEDY